MSSKGKARTIGLRASSVPTTRLDDYFLHKSQGGWVEGVQKSLYRGI